MSETRFRSGMLLFPNLTQLDLTGLYEVLAWLPGAETLTLDPVRSEHGLTILPMATLASCPPLGMRVLDLACGPGLVAAGAAKRGALPVGLDFCSAMIALARVDHPAVRFKEGDAEALPFIDGSFDVVVANFGVHHVADPVRALAQAHRVLRPGGWPSRPGLRPPKKSRLAASLRRDLDACDPKAADAPPPGGSLRLPEDLLRVLNAAGFTETEARRVRGEWRVATSGDLVEGFRRGTVRTAALIGAQSTSAPPAIKAAIARCRRLPRRGRPRRSNRRDPRVGGPAVTIADAETALRAITPLRRSSAELAMTAGHAAVLARLLPID